MKKSYLSQCVAALTTAAATSLATAPALAQDVEEVVVSGIRASILNAVDAKREADTIVEVVDAGDLSALPDASIADALGRLPGITTVRNSGQSSQLNIRGLNGDFIQTTLNGREQASTSAESESSRWMAFDQYPAELINQAAVYKSPKASLIEGGVAGSVELKTANPLEAKKEHNLNVSARYSYNDSAEDVGGEANGNRFTAAYQGKFMDDTVGLSLGFSHLEQPNSFTKARASVDDQLGYFPVDVDGTEYQVPKAYQWQAGSGTDTRDSFMATVVWEPSDNLTLKADYFATEFEREDIRHGVVVGSANVGQFSNVVADNGVFQSFDLLIADPHITNKGGTWIESRTEDQSSQADSDAFGLNLEWNITDTATLILDYSTSEGTKTRRDRLATMHAYDNYTEGDATWSELPNQSFSFTGNGDEIPTMQLTGNLDLTSFNQMKLGRYEEYPHLYTDDIESFRADFALEFDNPIFSGIELGVRLSERTFDSERATFLWGSRDGVFNNDSGSWCDDNVSEAADRPTVECSPIDLNGFASVGSVSGAPDHLVVNIDGLADSVFGPGNYDGVKLFSRDWTFIESGALTEKTDAFYAMLNLDWGMLTGNIGVRHVVSDVKMRGTVNVGTGNGVLMTDGVGETSDAYEEQSFGPEYSDTLPSLNLSFQVSDNDYIKVAAAKVMGRPPVGQMKGGAGSWFGTDGDGTPTYNIWTKGSPSLDPFRADQLDVSYEHYFEDEGVVTVAAFYKKINSIVVKNFFADGGDLAEAAGYTIPDGAPEGTIWGAYETFTNSDAGYIQGLEIAGTKTFTNLPGAFSGLGVTASYSYTESEIEVPPGVFNSEPLPAPGLSKNVWSTTAFWDVGKVSTHLNLRSRDEYVVIRPIPGSSTPVLAKGYTTMDWQISYAFTDKLQGVFQANNLTNEANKENYGVDSALGEYTEYGRQFYLGVNYSF